MAESTRKIHLRELTWQEAKARAAENPTVLFPTGSIEQHGPHLPVETDSRLVWEVSWRAAEQVADRINILVTPPLYFGYSTHHWDYPGTMTLNGDTYIKVIIELCDSLIRNGFKRIFLLNGHGGNLDPLKIAGRMLRDRHDDILVGAACYWNVASKVLKQARESPVGGMSHGCELEASMMWYLRPELVKPENFEKRIPTWRSPLMRDDLLDSGDIKVAYHFSDVSPKGVQGDPTLASREKGERFLGMIVNEVAKMLLDFSQMDLKNLIASIAT
jgi:creatinine amidohydrolase